METISDDDEASYGELREHLDQLPEPYPATSSGVEISLLKRIFTPEEARIASKLKFSWANLESLDSIYERLQDLGYSKEKLEELLDSMATKGGIMADFSYENEKRYGNAMLMIGIFEFQVNKLTPGFVHDFFAYNKEGWFQEYSKVSLPQLRVIPIGETIDQQAAIFPYDDVKKILEEAEGPFMVTNCICRQGRDLTGKPCKNTQRREVCMGWGKFASMYSKAGWGREISREEAIEILKENEKEGMILQIGNAMQPEYLCSCCTCCDPALHFLKTLPAPAMLVQSNYFARNDPDLCTGCGTCVDRCQMAAITLSDDKAIFDQKRCIGCGNCVAVCPSEAIRLQKKDWETQPPPSMEELYNRILTEKNRLRERAAKRKERQSLKKTNES